MISTCPKKKTSVMERSWALRLFAAAAPRILHHDHSPCIVCQITIGVHSLRDPITVCHAPTCIPAVLAVLTAAEWRLPQQRKSLPHSPHSHQSPLVRLPINQTACGFCTGSISQVRLPEMQSQGQVDPGDWEIVSVFHYGTENVSCHRQHAHAQLDARCKLALIQPLKFDLKELGGPGRVHRQEVPLGAAADCVDAGMCA